VLWSQPINPLPNEQQIYPVWHWGDPWVKGLLAALGK
jgi:hypothetical protein